MRAERSFWPRPGRAARICLAVAAALLSGPVPVPAAMAGEAAPAEAGPASGAGAGAEVRRDAPGVVRLGQRLRCPVCQGMAIGDSPAPMAQDMMRQVRRMWADGRNEDDIAAYFTARYGDWVLLDPPWRGAGLWVWVLPPVVLGAGAAAALGAMRRRAAAARDLAEVPPEQAAVGGERPHLPGEDEALRAIREEAAG